jgi:hypothetical protein
MVERYAFEGDEESVGQELFAQMGSFELLTYLGVRWSNEPDLRTGMSCWKLFYFSKFSRSAKSCNLPLAFLFFFKS